MYTFFYRIKVETLIAISILLFCAINARPISIVSIGREEALGQGRLSSVYVDSKDQPHVAADGGASVYFYDKINNAWRSSSLDLTTVGGSRQYYNPSIGVIPKTQYGDMLWCSGILFGTIQDGVGIGTITRENVAVGPTAINYSRKRIIPTSWDTGNMSTDPYTKLATTWVSGGWWQTYAYNKRVEGGSQAIRAGRIYIGVGGEANNISISKAIPVRHGQTSENANQLMANWHLATCGAIGYDNCNYNSSLRYSNGKGMVAWLYPSCFRGFGDDGVYVSVCGDLLDPEIAYICTSLSETHKGGAGVWGNVFDGTNMIYPPMKGMPIDPYGGSGLRRYAPQFAPHINGGAWVTWTRGGKIMVRYIAQTGEMGVEKVICDGVCSDIAVDSEGDLHLSYQNKGIKYRKLIPSDKQTIKYYGARAGDYNGDGKDDICAFNTISGAWVCKDAGSGEVLLTTNLNASLGVPTPCDYDGDGITDPAVYSYDGVWRITYSKSGNTLDLTIATAPVGIPVPANYLYSYTEDGKPYLGRPELAVYKDGEWYIRNQAGQRRLIKFGGKFAIPVVGDYDGDGRDEPAVFFYKTGTWAVYDWATKKAKEYCPLQFGGPNFIPFSADLDNDGVDNICLYHKNSATWYSLKTEALPNKVNIDGYPVVTGNSNTKPIPANYNGSGIMRAVYNPDTMMFFINGQQTKLGNKNWINANVTQ